MPHAALTQWPSNSSSPLPMPRILLADDDRIMRLVLRQALQHNGYDVNIVESGEEALAILAEHGANVDTVILDREMPGLKGLEVVERMKAHPQMRNIPVIMLTGTGEQDKIQEGIDAGVYYYLVKPVDNTLLRSVIESALRERRQKQALIGELTRYGAALKAMRFCQIAVRTMTEAEDTACFLASCFPDPERVVMGLMELLANAVEHGNLAVTFEEKNKLLTDNTWRSELDRRALLPEHAGKLVDVTYQHKEEGYLVQISDCGAGFDWKRYWHINPSRATASHGRGIARARLMAFDRLAYNEQGNQVTLMVAHDAGTGDYAW
ncbi:MAG: response regulator [Pseudomonadota bacterium]